MTPSPRTINQRDRRFARVRMLTRTIFVGSSVLSVGMVGYLATITKLHTNTRPATTTTTAPVPPTTASPAGTTGAAGAPTTVATVPVTTTTTCYTSPSGNTVCN
ncbi:MAG: hypothetical protein HKL85_10845 [Acidimicrobiaceae bacterium]|nr:hypothetical protein [Acidimicrobiaceae bacterium]